jgi:ribose/xylose/arabinose/galactoside ABC-type transport system permease subunit
MENTKKKIKIAVPREIGVLVVLILILIIMSIASPVFLTPTNLVNVVRQCVEIGIMAIGMTFLIVNGDMDLSIGSAFAVCAMIGGTLFKYELCSPTIAFIVMLLVGLGLGAVNGLLVTRVGIPAFIVTLGTMKIYRSLAYAISGGTSVSVFPESATGSWVWSFGAKINGVPVQIFIMIAMFVIAHIVLRKTVYGNRVYATGGNERAARLSGINTKNTRLYAFLIQGLCCAIAAVISLAYLNSVTTTSGEGREMDCIAAVILGGAALSGGRGTIVGSFIGVLIMGIVKNGMVLLSVPVFWQDGFIGLVVILAVLVDSLIHRKDNKR